MTTIVLIMWFCDNLRDQIPEVKKRLKSDIQQRSKFTNATIFQSLQLCLATAIHNFKWRTI